MELDLGQGDLVLDGVPVPPADRGTAVPPTFRTHVCCAQTAGLIKMPLGTKLGVGPGDIVLDGDPAPPPKKGHPNFRPMSIVQEFSNINADK